VYRSSRLIPKGSYIGYCILPEVSTSNKSLNLFELEGIEVKDIQKNIDERGLFAEIARKDWTTLFGDQWISQANLSISYPGMIRAWHRHSRNQLDYFLVIEGAMKIVAFDGNSGSKTYQKMVEIIASGERLQIVRIPGHYWHGTKTIGNRPSSTIYFVNNLYDYKNPDEERRPWNDKLIVNPKTNLPYDWNMPPHK
jgi:dTDP-4-dehydrorhamnose 3,5-epimerase